MEEWMYSSTILILGLTLEVSGKFYASVSLSPGKEATILIG
jgi:hypothetical protein